MTYHWEIDGEAQVAGIVQHGTVEKNVCVCLHAEMGTMENVNVSTVLFFLI